MRLHELRLPEFHRQGGLVVDFAAQRPGDPSLAFLIGPNGSGKSRVLEAIGQILAHLSAGIPPGLRFELAYELGEELVLVTTEQERVEPLGSPPPLDAIGGWLLVAPLGTKEWRQEHVRPAWPAKGEEVLPSYVVGLSSGPASRLDWALRESVGNSLSQRLPERPEGDSNLSIEAVEENLKGEEELVRLQLEELALRPRCLSISGQELVLPILALLSHPRASGTEDAIRDEVLDKTELVAGQSLRAFNFDVPPDWRARLEPQHHSLFEELLDRAARTVVLPTPLGAPDRAPDRRAVFVRDAALEEWIEEAAASPFIWFSHLVNWSKASAMRFPQLLFSSPEPGGLFRDRDLSDGEFLVAGRYSLLLLLRERSECLVLFDEPETHFNDRWKVDLVHDLTQMLEGGGSQIVIATHSDLTLTDADRSDVFVLGDEAGEEVAQAPLISPLGADRSEITQQVFGADSASGRRALEIVQSALEGEKPELEEALKRVGPGFQRFRIRYELEKRADDAS